MSSFDHELLETAKTLAVLGRGVSGVVLKALLKDERIVSVKKMLKSKDNNLFVKKEVDALKKVYGKHPLFPTFIKYEEDEKSHYIISEFIDGYDLFDNITQNVPCHTPLVIRKKMIRDIANALLTMKNLGIAHRDLKPENLIIYYDRNGNYDLKIIDWGYAEFEENFGNAKQCGSLLYAAPELLIRKKGTVGFHNDIWSFGVLCFTLYFDTTPFDEYMILQIVENDEWRLTDRELFRSYLQHFPELNFIKKIFVPYEKRITIEELLEEPFFKND